METFELPVSLRIRSSVDQVFQCLTSPEHANVWLCDKVEGQWIPGTSVYWNYGSFRQELRVIEVRSNELLRFRWNAYMTQPETEVEFHFSQVDQETRIQIKEFTWSLTLENVQIALDHACGWENTLCRLKAWKEAGVRI